MTERNMICTSAELKIHRNQFWQAAWIWIQKPHVINRRLFGVKVVGCFSSNQLSDNTNIVLEKLETLNYEDIGSSNFSHTLISLMYPTIEMQPCQEKDVYQITENTIYIFRKLLTKSRNYEDIFEVCIINYALNEIFHLEILPSEVKNSPSVSFMLRYKDDKIGMTWLNRVLSSNYEWIKYLLLSKLIKWAEESVPSEVFESSSISSLRLVPADEYSELYLQLKAKYGKEIVKKWPENTDPSKFVYEDIAIACYLCLLWNREKVKFVDLGCGNGLLVHILNSEGYDGFGIDVRARKIWSLYSPQRDLRVGTITPNCNSHFPDVDWIIGNHSDELTPWIPVFALRSSYNCKFFLLPCCAYEFNGQKYQRQNSSVSVYNDFIDHMKTICTKLGFESEIDRLRIPSTKRICIVGYSRSYKSEEYEEAKKEKIDLLFRQHTTEIKFKPRENVEKVRNCTKIDRMVTSKIVNIISKALTDKQMKFYVNTDCDIWSTEYSITFEDAVSMLEIDDLKKLKNECGGLQTLLRNHHSIFLIRAGRIYFRKPTEVSKKCDKWKERQCWFFHYHPLRCPLDDDKCNFIH